MKTTIALEAASLSKRYRRQLALDECSFALPAGRIAGLVGPNGAGKTTLLHMAVGLLAPTSGTISTLGSDPARDEAVLSRIGFVAQDTPLYRNFTVPDLIRYGEHMNRTWDSGFARERLGALGIPFDRKVGTFSGGQRAQVALALALAKRPALLLLDEPLASLDPLARREFLGALMEGVVEDGVTVLLSSHLVADLERVCDYLMILSHGHLVLDGAIDDLQDEHKMLIGRRRTARGASAAIAGVASVVEESTTARQSTLVVRTNGPILDPRFEIYDVRLEDLVLAYLGQRAPEAEDTMLREAASGGSR